MVMEKTATAAQELAKTDSTPPAETPEDRADAAIAAAVTAEKVATAPDPLQVLRDEVLALRREQGGFQGRMAQRVGQSAKDLGEQINGLRAQIVSRDEAAQLANMEPEEQVEYWRKRAQEPPKPQPAAKTDAWLSQDEQAQLAGQVNLLLEGAGLELQLQDPKLWVGAYQGMESPELLQIARQNIRGLRIPVKAEPKPAVKPPPSTRNMPKTARTDYSSRSELGDALAAGTIDSDQYRAELRRIQTGK